MDALPWLRLAQNRGRKSIGLTWGSMTMNMRKNAATHILLLTGPPGVGKTTVVQLIATKLGATHVRGFTTEEIRVGGQRVGFRLETFDGRSILLAHVEIRSPHRVGKYGVDIGAFDQLVVIATIAARGDGFIRRIKGRMPSSGR